MMGGGMLGTGFGIWGSIGIFLNLAILAGIVVLAVWAVQKIAGPGNRKKFTADDTTRSPSAREILDQRYARGDLSREEYKEMISDLSG
jgi:putative membrane protein